MEIIAYQDRHADDFARLNREWLDQFGLYEEADGKHLYSPRETILEIGGEIFIVERDGRVVGTCALVPEGHDVYEIAKLVVSQESRGEGLGRRLATFAVDRARERGAVRVVLLSSSKLGAALTLYESLGFERRPMPPDQPYATADVYMELEIIDTPRSLSPADLPRRSVVLQPEPEVVLPQPRLRTIALTSLALIAFAGNSLLCRAALRDGAIDAASFTGIRLASGALVLWLLVRLRRDGNANAGSWRSALALFVYAAGFSLAYASLTAATGALLLFGAVQATMIGRGLMTGERLSTTQWSGLAMAFAGLAGLLLPGLSTPPLSGALLMLGAGVAWGVYSLRGRGAGDPTAATAGNFVRTVPMAAAMMLLSLSHIVVTAPEVGYAIVSGALASGLGYVIWYSVLPTLKATNAATVQLAVPVIAALGGIVLLGEPLTVRFVLASLAVLGGIALVIRTRR